MKKVLTLLLALAMMLCLVACTGSGAEETKPSANAGLQVGYAKINVTPSYSVGLSGYSDAESRLSEGFVTYIYATCLAFTEGEETILLYTVDSIAMERDNAEKFRKLITESTGIPGDKIFFGATHAHSCPLKSGQYLQDLGNWVVEGAQKALADRAPAKMYAGTHELEGMNFVRHYEMADGTYAGSNFGNFNQNIVGYATESDPQMVLVKFDYEDESKKDVLMVNWQAHPDSGSELGRNQIAASWVGPLRDELEKLSGMQVAYFTGASGNQNKESRIAEDTNNLNWKAYGEKMGQLTNDALSCLQPVSGAGIKTTRQMFAAEIDHSWDHMLPQAKEVYNLWKSVDKATGDALGKTYGFTSSYQARAIISRANMGPTTELEINAFSIGGIGFTTGTYEMFSDHGLYVKENSPFDVTFIITGNSGYIPTPEAFEYRSYEADTGYYAPTTGQKLAEAYVEMLKQVQ